MVLDLDCASLVTYLTRNTFLTGFTWTIRIFVHCSQTVALSSADVDIAAVSGGCISHLVIRTPASGDDLVPNTVVFTLCCLGGRVTRSNARIHIMSIMGGNEALSITNVTPATCVTTERILIGQVRVTVIGLLGDITLASPLIRAPAVSGFMVYVSMTNLGSYDNTTRLSGVAGERKCAGVAGDAVRSVCGFGVPFTCIIRGVAGRMGVFSAEIRG